MKRLILSTLILPILFLTSCSSDDDDDVFVGESYTYEITAMANSGVTGDAKFIENEDNSVTIELDLEGTTSNGSHPAYIRLNSAAEGGAIVVILTPVNGNNGTSITTFSDLEGGAGVTFEDLKGFDGHITIHLSSSDNTTVAVGDIGENELTGTTKLYALNSLTGENISGTATFYERINGETLAVLKLTNTSSVSTYPAHIHTGSVATAPGAVLVPLVSVDGSTGMSYTNIAEFSNNTAFGYDDILIVDGYINVHNPNDINIIEAQGDIGIN